MKMISQKITHRSIWEDYTPRICPGHSVLIMPLAWNYPSPAIQDELSTVAKVLVKSGKGIMAADENDEITKQRLESVGLENTPKNINRYKELVLTHHSLNKYFSGILLRKEFFHKHSSKKVYFIDCLKRNNIIPGIRLDKEKVPLMGCNETTMQGLDDLHLKCKRYRNMGCRFAKWRCNYIITEDTPSQYAIEQNSIVLARFAAICQVRLLVPLVEIEISSNANYCLEFCQKILERVLNTTYHTFREYGVFLEGSLLCINFINKGKECNLRYTRNDIAKTTLCTLMRTVPSAIPGVLFSYRAPSEIEATLYLNTINRCCRTDKKPPWKLTFCFGRPLFNSALAKWAGDDKNFSEAQNLIIMRAKDNCLASLGRYVPEINDL